MAVALAAPALLLGACAPAAAPPPVYAGDQCLKELAARGVAYQAVAAPVGTGACAVDNPVEVTRTAVPWNQPGITSCPLAAEIDRFIGEAVQPLAERYLATRVTRFDQIGAYSCRGSTGQAGHWSEHAAGRAIDVSGFLLADGGRVSVELDWRRSGPKHAFLRAVARRACDYFNVVLTPDTDRYHYNHLHLDIGRYRLCSL